MEKALAVAALGGVDGVAEGQGDAHRAVELLVLGDEPSQREYAFTGSAAGFGQQHLDMGTVSFVDGCALSLAVISGDNTFANLSMATSSGKEYRFTAGSTQTIGGTLSLFGTAGNLLRLRSTVPGASATFSRQNGSFVDFVDVDDLHAEPQPIPTGSNSVVGENATGWGPQPVPVLSGLAMALLILGLLGAAARALRSSGDPGLR